ncbi:PREDICTED: glutamate-gated chloride channel-like isoform X2 [Priapulus caudatus]|uniref:Glutamate-gated chloride channel-like isoform X2 n=1 Tax=Priapulus caudatus TaxID=37621 RepID=A0ABM1DZP2_PRICU|nr:PREDICTED: glutamate-gated chloride channel-like isoform X2 [Priapulus caudatus]
MLFAIGLLIAHLSALPTSLAVINLTADMLDQEILDSLLGPDAKYDQRVSPMPNRNEPVIVTVDLYILALSSVDVIRMSFDADFVVRQRWLDRRLNFEKARDHGNHYIAGTPALAQSIWRSDLFFVNARDAAWHEVTRPNTLIRIFPNGTVQLNQRVKASFSCQMQLSAYPFDTQNCQIELGSFGYTNTELVFLWKPDAPFTINTAIKLPQFKLRDYIRTEIYQTAHYTGKFSYLRAYIKFDRDYEYHVTQSLMPCVFLVICSWVSFWLDSEATPARVALGVTTLLAIYTQSAAVRFSLPPVSYLKAIDIWFLICVVFIFGSLIEFALVNYFTRRSLKNPAKHMKQPSRASAEIDAERTADGDVKTHLTRRLTTVKKRFKKVIDEDRKKAKTIDVVSRVLFPVSFLVCILVFWCVYYVNNDDQ